PHAIKEYALWFGDLNDLKILPDAGQDLYIRIPASELETKNGCKGKIRIAVWVTIGVLCGMLFVSCLIWNGRKKATLKDKNKLGEGGFGSVFKHCWKFPCLCNWKRTKLLWHESMSMNLNGTEVLGFGLVLWWKYKHNQQAFFDVKGVCYLSTDFPHAHFLRVEVEEQPEISEAYSVSAVPFFVFFK
ncbi:hypothetical protein S83_004196, partial [Arachis hypogaea]